MVWKWDLFVSKIGTFSFPRAKWNLGRFRTLPIAESGPFSYLPRNVGRFRPCWIWDVFVLVLDKPYSECRTFWYLLLGMWDVFVLAESGTFSSLCLTSLTRNVGHFGTSKKLMTSLIVSSLSIALRDRTWWWIETKTSYSHHLLLLYLPWDWLWVTSFTCRPTITGLHPLAGCLMLQFIKVRMKDLIHSVGWCPSPNSRSHLFCLVTSQWQNIFISMIYERQCSASYCMNHTNLSSTSSSQSWSQ